MKKIALWILVVLMALGVFLYISHEVDARTVTLERQLVNSIHSSIYDYLNTEVEIIVRDGEVYRGKLIEIFKFKICIYMDQYGTCIETREEVVLFLQQDKHITTLLVSDIISINKLGV